MHEVARSIRVGSTSHELTESRRALGFMLGGLVAAEGCFLATPRLPPFKDGGTRLRFRFEVSLASRDRPLLASLRSFLGEGSIRDQRPRKPAWQPSSTLSVGSHRAHHAATIPFCEAFLLPSAKRDQYERWRASLFTYEATHPTRWGRGPSRCTDPGCDQPVRGRGLCRRHYYRATGY